MIFKYSARSHRSFIAFSIQQAQGIKVNYLPECRHFYFY